MLAGMRELAPETMDQLVQQLNEIAAGTSAQQAAKPGAGDDVGAREALVEIAFLVAAVDGEVSPLEVAQFGEAIEAAFGEGDVDVKAMLAKMSSRLEAEGWDKRMKAVARSLAGARAEGAYRIAVGVAFIDDDVAHAEAAALEAFAHALGISDDRAHAIMGEVREELFA
jgi:tellurite resistance protein